MIKIFSVKLLLIIQLIKQVVSECIFFSYQPILDKPNFEIEEHLSEYIIKQQENIGYGIWMKYSPFKEYNDLVDRSSLQQNYANYQQITKGGQFIYSIEQGETMQSLIIVFVNIDPERKFIEHHIYHNFGQTQNNLQFIFDNEIYEGVWIMFFVYIDADLKKTTYGFYNHKKGIQTQVIYEIPLLEQKIKHIQGGLYQYRDQQQQLVMLSKFTGTLSYAFTSKQDDISIDINVCVERFMRYYYCSAFYYVLTNYNQEMKGNSYINQTIIELDSPKYAIHGWIILNSINQSYLETTIFRITINKDYNDDLNLGDRVALLKYFQSKIPRENGFEISTYSYQFPVKTSYQCQDDDKILEFKDQYSELFIQWHQIQYEFGSDRTNGQPLFQIYFPSIDQNRKFSWNKSIRHFKEVQFQIYIGGDDYANSYLKGFISEMLFTIFCESDPIMIPPCHSTCNTCNGPTKQNCLSCSENNFRYLYKVENSCLCQDGYFENDSGSCESMAKLFPYISKQEFKIGCQLEGYEICDDEQIVCLFGYFYYNKQCIQCPNYNDIYSSTHFSCFNCVSQPSEFSQNLTCFEEAQTFKTTKIILMKLNRKIQIRLAIMKYLLVQIKPLNQSYVLIVFRKTSANLVIFSQIINAKTVQKVVKFVQILIIVINVTQIIIKILKINANYVKFVQLAQALEMISIARLVKRTKYQQLQIAFNVEGIAIIAMKINTVIIAQDLLKNTIFLQMEQIVIFVLQIIAYFVLITFQTTTFIQLHQIFNFQLLIQIFAKLMQVVLCAKKTTFIIRSHKNVNQNQAKLIAILLQSLNLILARNVLQVWKVQRQFKFLYVKILSFVQNAQIITVIIKTFVLFVKMVIIQIFQLDSAIFVQIFARHVFNKIKNIGTIGNGIQKHFISFFLIVITIIPLKLLHLQQHKKIWKLFAPHVLLIIF
ncbi:unnamed protein product [Paramecium sonneborni]|uniref:Insulin-like growth factor binding protein, N-terminal n=1 Tax=Paramecium sonneborni TaxID=65129 RepID=A0A8S1NFL5_9CILI|nr:unnamed protein product [Paramecium sonneborni]